MLIMSSPFYAKKLYPSSEYIPVLTLSPTSCRNPCTTTAPLTYTPAVDDLPMRTTLTVTPGTYVATVTQVNGVVSQQAVGIVS